MPSCLELRSGAIHQAVDNIRTEGLALDREKEKTLRLRHDKVKTLRKQENMALEQKNRCGKMCMTTHAFPCRLCEGGTKALPVLLPGKAYCHVMYIVPELGAEVSLHCRKAKLENAVKVKERMLQAQHNKPDPLQGAAGLQRDITRLNGQIETAVNSPCPLASCQRLKQYSNAKMLCTSLIFWLQCSRRTEYTG